MPLLPKRPLYIGSTALVLALAGATAWSSGQSANAAPAAGPFPATRPTTAASIADPSSARVVAFLEDRVRRDPEDITALNRLSGEYVRRFKRTGDDHDLELARATAEKSLAAVPAEVNDAGLGAKARAEFNLHGFAAARDDAKELLKRVQGKRYPLEILGDALLELGDLDAAADAYGKMAKFEDGEPNAGTEPRLARLALMRGDIDEAKKRYTSAVQLARIAFPPQPEVLAWCLVQDGQLAFTTGDWETAERQYQAALEASPTDWSVIDHLAELRAAQKRYGEAESLYEGLIARVPRPELMQALGDVYKAAGREDDARRWHRQALEKYLTAANAGSAHYYHHLAGYYCDVEPNAAEALKWAKKDLEVRHSAYAWDGLAWAEYQAGDAKAAVEAMDKALATGLKDAHVLYHASLIQYRAGDLPKAKTTLKQAAAVNPKFNEFHVHR